MNTLSVLFALIASRPNAITLRYKCERDKSTQYQCTRNNAQTIPCISPNIASSIAFFDHLGGTPQNNQEKPAIQDLLMKIKIALQKDRKFDNDGVFNAIQTPIILGFETNADQSFHRFQTNIKIDCKDDTTTDNIQTDGLEVLCDPNAWTRDRQIAEFKQKVKSEMEFKTVTTNVAVEITNEYQNLKKIIAECDRMHSLKQMERAQNQEKQMRLIMDGVEVFCDPFASARDWHIAQWNKKAKSEMETDKTTVLKEITKEYQNLKQIIAGCKKMHSYKQMARAQNQKEQMVRITGSINVTSSRKLLGYQSGANITANIWISISVILLVSFIMSVFLHS